MSDTSSSEPTVLPGGTATLAVGDSTWQMDVVGTLRQIQKKRRDLAKTSASPNGSPADPSQEPESWAVLDYVKELVKASGGPDINDTQAEWIEHHLALVWAQKKSEYNDAILAMQKSPNFTD